MCDKSEASAFSADTSDDDCVPSWRHLIILCAHERQKTCERNTTELSSVACVVSNATRATTTQRFCNKSVSMTIKSFLIEADKLRWRREQNQQHIIFLTEKSTHTQHSWNSINHNYGWRWSSCAHNLNSSYFSWYQLRARFRRFYTMFFLLLLLRLPLLCCWDFSFPRSECCAPFLTQMKIRWANMAKASMRATQTDRDRIWSERSRGRKAAKRRERGEKIEGWKERERVENWMGRNGMNIKKFFVGERLSRETVLGTSRAPFVCWWSTNVIASCSR